MVLVPPAQKIHIVVREGDSVLNTLPRHQWCYLQVHFPSFQGTTITFLGTGPSTAGTTLALLSLNCLRTSWCSLSLSKLNILSWLYFGKWKVVIFLLVQEGTVCPRLRLSNYCGPSLQQLSIPKSWKPFTNFPVTKSEIPATSNDW